MYRYFVFNGLYLLYYYNIYLTFLLYNAVYFIVQMYISHANKAFLNWIELRERDEQRY